MYLSSYLLKGRLLSFCKYIKHLGPKYPIDEIKLRVKSDLNEILRLMGDINTVKRYDNVTEYNLIKNCFDRVDSIKTTEEMIHMLDDIKDIDTENNIVWLYYETWVPHVETQRTLMDKDILYEVFSKIKPIGRPFKIFNPMCYDYVDEERYNDLVNSEIYVLADPIKLTKDKPEYIHKRILGEVKDSYISNKVFDIIYLCPELDREPTYNKLGVIKDSKESLAAKTYFRYLREGGLFILTMPYHRLFASDILLVLAKNFKNIQFVRNGLDITVTFLGIKEYQPSYADEYIRMKYLKLQDIPFSDQFDCETINIPREELTVNQFKGSVFDKNELASIIDQDGLLDDVFEKMNRESIQDDTHPPLPFNIGQIGLILTSGCLDGVVNEIGDVNHIIKGMVTKTTEKTEERVGSSIAGTIVTANKVQINIMDAAGNFTELA